MNNRKNALLLSGFLLLCVWLILFLVAVTEEGATAYNFGIASTIAGTCGAVCMIVWIVLDVVEERKDASGIYNFEYYRLKRRTRKELEQARETHFSNLAYLYDVEEIEYNFTRDARTIGIEWEQIAADFDEIQGAIK